MNEREIKDAYGRMRIDNQGWAKKTGPELDFILSKVDVLAQSYIADFGCGQGRHLIDLKKRGFENLHGIDFVQNNIETANKNAETEKLSGILFEKNDVRKVKLPQQCGLILCLFDVIGSFASDKDNEAILKNIYDNLETGGYAVISVMNMELTKNMAKYRTANVKDNPKMLFELKSSNIMQTTGNIFNPEYYLLEEKTKLVFRKEQFSDDGMLPAEYVIRDRRYEMEELENICKKCKFEIIDKRFVRAGEFDKPLKSTALNAKEILMILKK